MTRGNPEYPIFLQRLRLLCFLSKRDNNTKLERSQLKHSQENRQLHFQYKELI